MKNIICYFDTSNFGHDNFNGYSTLKQFQLIANLYYISIAKQRELDPFKLVLITDDNGVKLLINQFQLEFDEVRLINMTSRSKYEILNQNDGYIKIDWDVIPFSIFPLHLYSAEILVQEIYNPEIPNFLNDEFIKKFGEFNRFVRYTDDVYEQIKEDIQIKRKINSIGFGIFGGNNVTLLKKYSEAVIEFKEKNKIHNDQFFQCIYSYYFFQQNSADITPIISELAAGKNVLTLYDRTFCFEFTEYSKKNKIILEAIENLVKNWYPNTYNKLIEL